MKHILVVPRHITSINEFIPLAVYLKNNSDVKVSFLIIDMISHGFLDRIKKENLDYIISDNVKIILNEVKLYSKLINLIKRILARINRNIFKDVESLETELIKLHRIYGKRYKEIKTLFEKYNFHSVIISGDRHWSNGYEPAILKICDENNIASIIPPYCNFSDEERLLIIRDKIEYIVEDEITINKYSSQIRFNKLINKHCLYFPLPLLKVLERNDVLPDNPWIMGGGLSTKILADAEETKQRYLKDGGKGEKISITGHLKHDTLYEKYHTKKSVKKVIMKKYNLQPEKRIIIVSLDSAAEDGFVTWVEQFRMIRFICDTLVSINENTLISLHPKMMANADYYSFINSDYGLTIVNESIDNIIPIGDIFVSSFSSTVLWAAMCNIPVVLFDFVGFNYKMYNYLKGVVIVNAEAMFAVEIKKLLDDNAYYSKMSLEQEKMIHYLSPFDGKCGQRIIEEVVGDN